MVRYYHGTTTRNEKDIDKNGICSAQFCPTGTKGFVERCRKDIVYLTSDLRKAEYFGNQVARIRGGDLLVYKVTDIPSTCKIERDPEMTNFDDGAIVVSQCQCLRPTAKCHPNRFGTCKWRKL